MAQKKRPARLAELTTVRSHKARQYFMQSKRIKKYCGQLSSEAGSVESLIEHTGRGLRSMISKELFVLTVPDCGLCNTRTIEAFQHECLEMEKMKTLLCQHKKEIMMMNPLGSDKPDDLAPPITIPAQDAALSRQSYRPAPTEASSMSSINIEKMKAKKEELDKKHNELCEAHEVIRRALEDLEEGELQGYDNLYSEEDMNKFEEEFTDDYLEVEDLAKQKIEELERLRDFDEEDVFEENVEYQAQEGRDTVRNLGVSQSSVSPELEQLVTLGGQRGELRESQTAQHGSPERLLQERAHIVRAEGSTQQIQTTRSGQQDTVVVASTSSPSTSSPAITPTPSTQATSIAQASSHSVSSSVASAITNTADATVRSSIATTEPVITRVVSSTGPGIMSAPIEAILRKEEQERNILFSQMKRRGRTAEEHIAKIESGLRAISNSRVPSLLVDRTRGWLAEAQKKLQEFELSYQEYLKVLPKGEQGAALMEMNSVLSRHESSLSQLMAVLDNEETVLVENKAKAEADRASREPSVSREPTQSRRVFLERTKLPTFSGKVEEWPDFSKQWKELTRGEGFPEVIALSKLRDSIPAEGKDLLVGVESLDLAWQKLAECYGDRKIGILTVQKRLNSLVLTGEDYNRIEKLAAEVDRAQNLLRSLGAPNQLTQDFEMVGCLVAKLPRSYQTDWDRHITSLDEAEFEQTYWEKFVKWLAGQKKIAVSARLRAVANQQTQRLPASGSAGGSGGEASGVNKPKPKDSLPFWGSSGCWRCGGSGHRGRNCPSPSTRQVKSNNVGTELEREVSTNFIRPKTKEEWLASLPEVKKRVGQCPLCKQGHTYNRKFDWGQMEWPSSMFKSCTKFQAMSPVQRGKRLEELGGCARCTSWLHKRGKKGCPRRDPTSCPETEGGRKCGKDHDQLLHGSGSAYCSSNSVTVSAISPEVKSPEVTETTQCSHASPTVLLEMQTVDLRVDKKKLKTIMFFDNGSTATICTHAWAKRAGIKGEEITYYMRVVGEQYTKRNTLLYTFTMSDADGEEHQIEAFGIDTITEVDRVPDLSNLKHLFPGVPAEVFKTPVGPVDLLVGSNYRALQPRSGKEVRHLRLVKSRFGKKVILTGTDRLIGSGGHRQTHLLKLMKTAVPSPPVGVKILHTSTKFPSFFEAEEMGAAPQPHCEACSKKLKSCKECTYRGQMLTRDQREVVRKVEATMRLDKEEARIHVQYPLKPEAYLQTDNSRQAKAMQGNIERRLLRDQLMEDYQKEMQKAVQAGSVVKMSKQELESWDGPVHYLCHFPVLKPESVTTKVRIVANSKMKNNNTGLSLNDVVEPGPNALNGLLDVLILWRSVEVGLLFDLTKAYQQLVTGPIERNLRRFVYRDSPEKEWETYAYDRVTFGDVIAGLCLELAKALVAKHGEKIDLLACVRFLVATYCDDHCGGGSKEEVQQMRGEQIPEGGTNGTMSQILKQGGFKTNFMVRSKDCTEEEKAALGGTVLGLGYEAMSDKLEFVVTLTMVTQGKKRKKKTITFEKQDIQQLLGQERVLTKRMALSLVMGQYDPLGLICPFGQGENPPETAVRGPEQSGWLG